MTKLFTYQTAARVPSTVDYQYCITLGNYVMGISLLLFIMALAGSFGVNQQLGLTTQVLAHIMTILSAAAFKVGYVIRCVGAFNLGHKAF